MKTILLVEDERIIQLSNQKIFEMLNYTILSAFNGSEAVKLCNENIIDLILMDIQMPKMSGINAAREIRQIENYKKIPIIFLTAYHAKKEILKIPGRNLFLSKPINMKKIINILEEI